MNSLALLKENTETFEEIKNIADSNLANVVNINEYKDIKKFVTMFNTAKPALEILFKFEFLELMKNAEDKNFNIKEFGRIIKILNNSVDKIKHHRHKSLKKNFLRLDNYQLELLKLLNDRYNQAVSEELSLSIKLKKVLEFSKNYETSSNRKLDLEKLEEDEKLNYFIGMIYHVNISVCPEIATPTVKKIINNFIEIDAKHNLDYFADDNIPNELIYKQLSLKYEEALKNLAQ